MSKKRAVFTIHYRYAGSLRPDPAKRHEVSFGRYDPNHPDGERGRTYRTYKSFTVASARRVRRLLEGGHSWWAEDRGGAYKDFGPPPWELRQETDR